MSLFANAPGFYLLAVFPILLLLALFRFARSSGKAVLWGGMDNVRKLSHPPAREWDTLRAAALWSALALTFIAFARPQWGDVSENIHRIGIDVVILLDTSRSMAATDATPSRLERSRMEIRSFLGSDHSDRVGLVAFSGVPVTLSPLTEDTGAVAVIGRGGEDDAVLAAADVPISLRLAGSALEDRGIAIASHDVRDAAGALWIARAARRTASRGLGICVVTMLAVVLGAALGWMTPMAAALLGLGTEAWTVQAGPRLLRRVDLRVPMQQ